MYAKYLLNAHRTIVKFTILKRFMRVPVSLPGIETGTPYPGTVRTRSEHQSSRNVVVSYCWLQHVWILRLESCRFSTGFIGLWRVKWKVLTLSLGFSESIAVCAAFIATFSFFSPDDRYVVRIDRDLSIMTMMSFGFVAVKLYHGLHSRTSGIAVNTRGLGV